MATDSPVESVLNPISPISEPTPESDNPPAYDWKNDIHPDVKAEKLWDSVKDVKGLTKAYADAARYNIGAIKIPAENAAPEVWSAFYEKLGRPTDSTAYVLSEEASKDSTITGLRDVAHQAGLTPTQWNKLRDGYNSAIETKNAGLLEVYRSAEADLKAAWGGAYDQNVGRIQRTIKQLGGEEALDAVVSKGLGNDVAFLKMMHKASKALQDEKIVSNDMPGVPTSEASKAELDSLTSSKPYLDGRHPEHDAAVQRAKTLFELLYS